MYAVSLKNSIDRLRSRRCFMGVSLNSSNHRGEKLYAMVKWINQNFDECIIGLTDTLDRYNQVELDLVNKPESFERVHKQGSMWLEENKYILEELAIKNSVYRWNFWHNHEKFESYFNQFIAAYNLSHQFKAAVDMDVHKFLSRRDVANDNSAAESCKLYLLEELAGQSIVFETFPDTVEVYPGRQQKCFSFVREGRLPFVSNGLQQSNFVNLYIYQTVDTALTAANTNEAQEQNNNLNKKQI